MFFSIYLWQTAAWLNDGTPHFPIFDRIKNSLRCKDFGRFQFDPVPQTHPPPPSWPISPGLSIRLSLLPIYYSDSPVSTGGRLLRRDHLMIDGSPEVTRVPGAKETLGIQETSPEKAAWCLWKPYLTRRRRGLWGNMKRPAALPI